MTSVAHVRLEDRLHVAPRGNCEEEGASSSCSQTHPSLRNSLPHSKGRMQSVGGDGGAFRSPEAPPIHPVMKRTPSSQPGLQGSPYGAATPPYNARPQAHWNTGPRPMVHPYVPTTSSRTAQQQQQQQMTGIAPHLHPAYSGRGRPPLALGRRPPGATPTSSKRSSSQSQQQSSYNSNPGTPSAAALAAAAAAAAQQHRPRKPVDGKEPTYLSTGTNNRLLLSLRSGLPSHVDWALSRLTHASFYNLEALSLDTFPGMTDTLLRFPRRLVAAIKGEEAEKWEPNFWEQQEREVDGMGAGSWQSGWDVEDIGEDDDEDDATTRMVKFTAPSVVREIPAVFQPGSIASHKRMLDQAVSAMLVLRNVAMNEKNERILLAYSRTINSLVCDILSLPNIRPTDHLSAEWSEMQGMEEMRIYALDLLEVTRIRLHIRKRSSIAFNARGEPVSFPVYSEPSDLDGATANSGTGGTGTGTNSVEDDMIRAARRAAAGTSDFLFSLLVWHLHTTSDRSILMGCLRCLGALAAEERNEAAFVEMDMVVGTGLRQNGSRRSTGLLATTVCSPGILKKCLTLLPLTQDSALLEAALDCLYQVINIGDNALRLATCVNDGVTPLGIGIARPDCGVEETEERGVGDVRTIIRHLTRNLIYGRVVWDRTHQLTLHPALHGNVPSAVASRRKERDDIARRRRMAESDEKERSKLRRLQRKEWLELKDKPEPERLKAWMKLIYEAKEGGEITQMEFWTTYSSQFGPYSHLGGPALQPAAEVIRTVSSVFPGALAMVIQNQKFIVRGVEARDRSIMRRFECKWDGCHAPETETFEAVEGHIRAHTALTTDGCCHWSSCNYSVSPPDAQAAVLAENLKRHVMTHLPETDEEIDAREALERQRHREEDLLVTKTLKSDKIETAVMANGARYISGPTALMPNSNFAAEKRRIEAERQEVKRRRALNTPIRGTVDLPDMLVFSVTRTPMDPETSKPTGISSTSGLILRSLARTTATVLIKAGLREKRKTQSGNNSLSSLNERFGLPIAMSGNDADANGPSQKGAETLDANGVGTGTGGIGLVEDWASLAASRIMDALLDVEDQIMAVASENDILCPMLNETLAELKPEPGESMWTEAADEDERQDAMALDPALPL